MAKVFSRNEKSKIKVTRKVFLLGVDVEPFADPITYNEKVASDPDQKL